MQLTPAWRLVLRALLAGVAAFVQQLQATDHLDRAVVVAALIAAGWAVAEYLLPFLNATVGIGKDVPK
jgi:F0F1-type ATP synthase alpha subunit